MTRSCPICCHSCLSNGRCFIDVDKDSSLKWFMDVLSTADNVDRNIAKCVKLLNNSLSILSTSVALIRAYRPNVCITKMRSSDLGSNSNFGC